MTIFQFGLFMYRYHKKLFFLCLVIINLREAIHDD